MSNPITTAISEPNVEPDTESGTNTVHAELVTAAAAMRYTRVVRLSNIGTHFQKIVRKIMRRISRRSLMRSARGVPNIRMANGIAIASSNSSTASPASVASLVTRNQTRHAASTDVPSKCLASVSHTQPGVSATDGTFDPESPRVPTSNCPPRAWLLNCIVPSQPEYVHGFRSPLAGDMVVVLP